MKTHSAVGLLVLSVAAAICGCSSGKQRLATEQLVMSDSVDRSVARIDFSPLQGQKVFLDTKFMLTAKTPGFVNPDYVISSLRQQMMAYDVRLMDKPEDAPVIVEARCGVLGSDGHDVSFGIPAGNNLAGAATAVSGYPMPPILPEISLIKRMDQLGATKVALFAYDRETKEPIWQSGISTSMSTAKDYWVFGVGPIQRGSIYGGTRFAGDPLKPFDPTSITQQLPNPVATLRQGLPFHSKGTDDSNSDASVTAASFEQSGSEETSQPLPPVGETRPPPANLHWAPVPPRQ